MSELWDDFAELFQGRMDAIGLEEGGCARISVQTGDWALRILGHLEGTHEPIGVYPMVMLSDVNHPGVPDLGWHVHWGCIDFDEGEEESWVHAVNTRAVLEQFGITAWIERSRSKGFHTWVFADSWVPAKTMRHALLAVCQLVGAPTKEINPKQEELTEGQLGNYVRLPYPGALQGPIYDHRRTVFARDEDVPLSVQSFVYLARWHRTNEAQLEKVAGLLKRKPRLTPIRSAIEPGTEPIRRLSGLAYTILMEGPKDGVDRSTTLWKLATRIHDDGTHTFEEALDIMIQADLAWGKFMERGDSGERELRRMLEKVWDA